MSDPIPPPPQRPGRWTSRVFWNAGRPAVVGFAAGGLGLTLFSYVVVTFCPPVLLTNLALVPDFLLVSRRPPPPPPGPDPQLLALQARFADSFRTYREEARANAAASRERAKVIRVDRRLLELAEMGPLPPRDEERLGHIFHGLLQSEAPRVVLLEER